MNWIKKLFGKNKIENGYKVADAVPWPDPPSLEEYQSKISKLKNEIEELNKISTIFEIGDWVKYTKIPNEYVMGVSIYTKYEIVHTLPNPSICTAMVSAQYFITGELKTIRDSAKWFEKVERK